MNTKYLRFVVGAVWLFLGMFALQAQTKTPGGVTGTEVWLTPDSYTGSTWNNIIPSAVGNFTAPQSAPAKVNSGYNFHPSVKFASVAMYDAPNRMTSTGNFSLASDYGFTTFIVAINGARYGTYGGAILGFFNGGITSYANRTYFWNTTNAGRLQSYWTGTVRNLGNINEGLITIDNLNKTGGSTISSYKDGNLVATVAPTGTTGAATFSNPVYLGWCGTTTYDHSWDGTIQELIIVKNAVQGVAINSLDLQKIQSYLAIKYGISLGTGDYLTSASTSLSDHVVWDRASNVGYNYNIFGIGRDDVSNLYQVQSQSNTNRLTTVFLDDKVHALNKDAAPNLLNNGDYLILGDNNGKNPIKVDPVITDLTGYLGSNLIANADNQQINMQSNTIYKAQLTGKSSITVNLQVNTPDYRFVLVSNAPNFIPSATTIYAINGNTAKGVVLSNNSYIRYLGITQGPGGIGVENLRLWLRADDEGSLGLESVNRTDARVRNYPLSGTAPLEAVTSWMDPIRDKTYSYSAGGSGASHLTPVYERVNPLTNFHPAVRFWGDYVGATGNYATYLSTAQPIGNNATTRSHTAYFLVNNDFNNHNWVYSMMFGAVTPANNADSYRGPGYGVQRTSDGRVVGRFRTSYTEGVGFVNLFQPGSTSIEGFHVTIPSGNDGTVKFRFNGQEEAGVDFGRGNMNLQHPSVIGLGYRENRTLMGVMSEAIILEEALSAAETAALESYMAIKYGLTLRPGGNRFDYSFSNGKKFFPGLTSIDPKYQTYYNNIAAVIRDDGSGLYNRQAHSTNAGSLLHIGVAGTRFGPDAEFGDLNDGEAVVWGTDGVEGIERLPLQVCGDFDYLFERTWMLKKITDIDPATGKARNLPIIIGAENNKFNSLGSDGFTYQEFYDRLEASYNVYLVVSDNPNDLKVGSFNPKALVPLNFINSEHQGLYTLTDSITYITFGYKLNKSGCPSEMDFTGTRNFDWSKKWTSNNYNLNTGTGVRTIPSAAGYTDNLDDEGLLTATTTIVYDDQVRAANGYPRFTTSPRGGLELTRTRGTVNSSKVTVTVKFNHPVRPEFFISGLDSRSNQRDVVTIYGRCQGTDPNSGNPLDLYPLAPTLSYAGPGRANYDIRGITARVNGNGSNITATATTPAGRVNVSFDNGITELVIEYTLTNRVTTATQQIFISPISVRNALPLMPINEDGLGFTKQVKDRVIFTCEPVEYTFNFENVNFTHKRVSISDTLPNDMKWKINAVGLDSINAIDTIIKISYGSANGGTDNVLNIDSLLIKCTSRAKISATAVLAKTAGAGIYDNRAYMYYERVTTLTTEDIKVPSVDTETLADYTTFEAILGQRDDTIKVAIVPSRPNYTSKGEVSITYTVNNPNAPINQIYLDFAYNEALGVSAEKFTVAGFTATGASAVALSNSLQEDGLYRVAGNAAGTTGFTLPTGTSTFKITFKTPKFVDIDAKAKGKKTDFIVSHNFYSADPDIDPCVLISMEELTGEIVLPYTASAITTNENTTTKTVK